MKRLRYTLMGVVFGIIVSILFICLDVLYHPIRANALTQRQIDTADAIADITLNEYPTYGRLPSIAVGQAFVESELGKGGNNLFGVRGQSGRDTVSATYGYLNCLDNQYFRGEGSFILDREEQLAIIMKGGRYCEGEYPYGRYYYNVINSIYRYGWDKYDKPLIEAEKRKLEAAKRAKEEKIEMWREEERKSKWNDEFTLIFNPMLLPWQVITDEDVIKGGTILIGYDWMDVVGTKQGLGMTIETGNRYQALCIGHTVLGDVVENAVG